MLGPASEIQVEAAPHTPDNIREAWSEQPPPPAWRSASDVAAACGLAWPQRLATRWAHASPQQAPRRTEQLPPPALRPSVLERWTAVRPPRRPRLPLQACGGHLGSVPWQAVPRAALQVGPRAPQATTAALGPLGPQWEPPPRLQTTPAPAPPPCALHVHGPGRGLPRDLRPDPQHDRHPDRRCGHSRAHSLARHRGLQIGPATWHGGAP